MSNKDILKKLIQHTQKVITYCAGKSFEEFVEDTMCIEACVFNISQIGELSHRLEIEFVKEHTEIAWNQLYGLRNRIVHDYEGVNLHLIWEIVNEDIPELIELLKRIEE